MNEILSFNDTIRARARFPRTLGFVPSGGGSIDPDWTDPTLDPEYVSGGDPSQYPTYSSDPGGFPLLPLAVNSGGVPYSQLLSNIFVPRTARPVSIAPIGMSSTREGGSSGGGQAKLDSILKAIETGLVAFAKPGNAYPASRSLSTTGYAAPGTVQGGSGLTGGVGSDVGRTAGGFVDSIVRLITVHPLATLLGAGAIGLYLIQPSGRSISYKRNPIVRFLKA
jgi:hypothetical protein